MTFDEAFQLILDTMESNPGAQAKLRDAFMTLARGPERPVPIAQPAQQPPPEEPPAPPEPPAEEHPAPPPEEPPQ